MLTVSQIYSQTLHEISYPLLILERRKLVGVRGAHRQTRTKDSPALRLLLPAVMFLTKKSWE